MPDSVSLAQVAALAAQLPRNERRQLAETILHDLTAPQQRTDSPGRAWRDIRGSVAYPLLGEDAQVWVSQGRQEADARRPRLSEGGG